MKVACGTGAGEVAEAIALLGADEAEVRPQGSLQDVLAPVDGASLLGARHDRVDANGREEGGDATRAGAQALGEDALRRRLELELTGADLFFTGRGPAVDGPTESPDKLRHLAILRKRLMRKPVRHDRQVARARLIGEGHQQIDGTIPDRSEPANTHHRALEYIAQGIDR
jgi:hypothetical protein